jgi:methionine-rich copper-binding protein CopC
MSRPRSALATLLAAVLLAALPVGAAAHSELESSTPAAGEVVVGSPTAITGAFTEPVDPGRSSMELRGPDGSRIARGGVPADGPRTRMTIIGFGPLQPGRYVVRWTTVTADDDGVERGTFRFTVVASTPAPASPAPNPAASLTAEPGRTSTAAPAPTAPSSDAPTAPPPTPGPDASPGASPDPDPTGATADVLIPLVVLAVILGGGVAWFARRRR